MRLFLFSILKSPLISLLLAPFAFASPQIDDYSNMPKEIRFTICQKLLDQGDINSLLNLRKTDKESCTFVNAFIVEALIRDASLPHPTFNPTMFKGFSRLFQEGASLHDSLKEYLHGGALIAHKSSALRKILAYTESTHFHAQEVMAHEQLTLSLYHRRFGAQINDNLPSTLRKKSILQHLASSFQIISTNNQALNESRIDHIASSLAALKKERHYLFIKEAVDLEQKGELDARHIFITINDSDFQVIANKMALGKLVRQNPEITLLLDVGQEFVQNGILVMRSDDLPPKLKHLSLTNAQCNVTKVGDWFLWETNLTSLSFSGFNNLTVIGINFLAGAKSITSLDASGIPNLPKIGNGFLA